MSLDATGSVVTASTTMRLVSEAVNQHITYTYISARLSTIAQYCRDTPKPLMESVRPSAPPSRMGLRPMRSEARPHCSTQIAGRDDILGVKLTYGCVQGVRR